MVGARLRVAGLRQKQAPPQHGLRNAGVVAPWPRQGDMGRPAATTISNLNVGELDPNLVWWDDFGCGRSMAGQALASMEVRSEV